MKSRVRVRPAPRTRAEGSIIGVHRQCWQRGWRSLLCALGWRILYLRPIAPTNQYRQTRIFCEPRVFERKLTHKESRTAIGLNPPRILATLAKAGVRMSWSVGDHSRTRPIVYTFLPQQFRGLEPHPAGKSPGNKISLDVTLQSRYYILTLRGLL